MKGAVTRAEELVKSTPGAWMPQQFDNPANVTAHRERTAKEVLEDFPQGFDYLITGVGTGGHISGVGDVLKQHFPKLRVLAVEPAASPVIAGGQPGPHPLQGLGANFVPTNLHRAVLDGLVPVQNDEAFDFARRAAKEEGLFVGISTGAALAGVAKTIREKELARGSRILTFNYDTGERYLSVDNLF
jgi:cysteine synthase A